MKNRLAQVIKKQIEKEAEFKIKANIDWNNIGKVLDCRGKSYKMSLEGKNVRLIGNGKNKVYPMDLSIPFLYIYDRQGNLISSMEDYA